MPPAFTEEWTEQENINAVSPLNIGPAAKPGVRKTGAVGKSRFKSRKNRRSAVFGVNIRRKTKAAKRRERRREQKRKQQEENERQAMLNEFNRNGSVS